MNNKIIITLATQQIVPYCKEILETQHEYATRNGFDYSATDSLFWDDLHPSFSKVHEIDKALLEGYEFVIWLDADIAVMDYRADFLKLLEPDWWLAAYQQTNWKTWRYLCNGFFIIRNSDLAREYVDAWIGQVETRFIQDMPFEQYYSDQLIRDRNYNGIRCCDAWEMGCFCPEVWHDGTLWKEGMPSIHLAGPATWERKQEIFVSTYLPLVKK